MACAVKELVWGKQGSGVLATNVMENINHSSS
jgi:hypothetical protein